MQIAIVGLGSILMGDDGVGPYCLEVLKGAFDFPENVHLVELGTPGPEFGHILLDWDRLIVIDAVKAKGDPGELRLYDRQEILSQPAPQRMSPHDPSLRDALLTADFVGEGPQEVTLVGVIPAKVEMGTELSPKVKEAVPQVGEKILEILQEWGIQATEKEEGSKDIWWSRSDG
jgi:hydrogenase maturation protease